jgi:hypothetical protein
MDGGGLENIDEDEEVDAPDDLDSIVNESATRALLPLGASTIRELRQIAEQGDANYERYSVLLEQAKTLVAEVKSALYDADQAGHAFGAEVLLDEVKAMLADVSQNTLVEAAQLQRPAEQWLGLRKTATIHLHSKQKTLEELIQRRAELARKSNEESRAECDRLWRQIRDWEAELDTLPRSRVQGPMSPHSEGVMSPMTDKSATDPIQMGGLTLTGAHSLLRAFAGVLRPHVSAIIPRDADERLPAEAVALEFLTACAESEQQMDSGSPPDSPQLEAPTLRRFGSSPSVCHGIRVESQKPVGMLSIPSRGNQDPRRMPGLGGDRFPHEQEMMLAQLGESF